MGSFSASGTGGSVSYFIGLNGCTTEGPVCTIENAKGTVGEIDISASGKLTMNAGDNENITALVSSSNLATVFMSGAKCTLPEESTISGSLTLTILEALRDLKEHLAHLDGEGLFDGNEPAIIDGAAGAGTALLHLKEASGLSYAIHLTGL